MKKGLPRIVFLVMVVALLLGTAIAWGENTSASDLLSKNPGIPNAASDLTDSMMGRDARAADEVNLLLNSFGRSENGINFPNWHGGAYVNQDQSAVIQATRLDKDIVSDIIMITGNKNILFREIKYSYAELKSIYDSLVDLLSNGYIRNVIAYIVINAYENNIAIAFLIDENIRDLARDKDIIRENDIQEYIVNRFKEDVARYLSIDPFLLTYDFISELAQPCSELKAGQGVDNTAGPFSLGFYGG